MSKISVPTVARSMVIPSAPTHLTPDFIVHTYRARDPYIMDAQYHAALVCCRITSFCRASGYSVSI